jgi:CheY-like chemotaxis protein
MNQAPSRPAGQNTGGTLPPVGDADVYQLTDRATRELHGARTTLSPAQLELLVLVDGMASVAQIKQRARTLAPEAAEQGLRALLRDQFIATGARVDSDALDFGSFLSTAEPPRADAGVAPGEIDSGTLELQKQGFYVRIARSATQERSLAEGQKLNVLVVEDEQHLAKLLRTLLTLEGFNATLAGKRDEILAALRAAPRPDLVLLDVVLPDIDGFQVLAALRQHPAFKAVPVVMLTSRDNRDAVLKGLSGGATGYITKPFEVDVLMKAMRSVLGLPESKG